MTHRTATPPGALDNPLDPSSPPRALDGLIALLSHTTPPISFPRLTIPSSLCKGPFAPAATTNPSILHFTDAIHIPASITTLALLPYRNPRPGFNISIRVQEMSAGGAFGGNRGARPVPPEKGVFPLDHMHECDLEKKDYIACLKSAGYQSGKCRIFSKKYLECRMERNLMAKQDMSELGFGKDDQPASAEVMKLNEEHAGASLEIPSEESLSKLESQLRKSI